MAGDIFRAPRIQVMILCKWLPPRESGQLSFEFP
jgi:hypothetical protein